MPQAVFDDPDGILGMLRDSVAALASRHPGPSSMRARRSDGLLSGGDDSLWQAMAEAGWTGLLLPEELGGSGLGIIEQAILSEALGRALIPEPIAAGAVFASVLLRKSVPSAERDRLAKGLASGELRVVPAWHQPNATRGGKPLRALLEGDGAVIEGNVLFVDAVLSATDFLAVATTNDGAALISVPANAAGLEVETRPGVDGAIVGNLRFEGCRSSHVLAHAESVDELVSQAIDFSRVSLAAELAGIASRAVEMTISYTKDRMQFGKPIASFQVVQHRLVDMWGDAEFACASLVNAAHALTQPDAREAQLAILAAKARCGDAATSICRRAVHLHGAMGFTDEHDIGLYLKRSIALNATLGQPEQLRLEFVNLERAA